MSQPPDAIGSPAWAQQAAIEMLLDRLLDIPDSRRRFPKNLELGLVVLVRRALIPAVRNVVAKDLAARPRLCRPAPHRKAIGKKYEHVGEIVAGLLGYSRRTLEKADLIVTAAEQYPHQCDVALRLMNRQGMVDGAYNRLPADIRSELIKARRANAPARADHLLR